MNNPADKSSITNLMPTLALNSSIDVDFDQILYDFVLYSEYDLSNVLIAVSAVETSWQVSISLTENASYCWRARAVDEHGAESEWTEILSFFVNVTNERPSTPVLNTPISGGTCTSLTPTLSVANANDPDIEALDYEFELYFDQSLSNKVTSISLPQGNVITSWTLSTILSDNTTYYWRVSANDGTVYSSWMTTAVFEVNIAGADTIVFIKAKKDVLASEQTTQTVDVTDSESPINGVCVEIPAGAITTDCTITVGEVINPPELPISTKAIGRVIEFGPAGIIFTTPVFIKIPYTQSDLENAGINNAAELEVFTYNTHTLSWEKIHVDNVDIDNSILICKVDHFSMYTIAMTVIDRPSDPPDGGGGGCFINTNLW